MTSRDTRPQTRSQCAMGDGDAPVETPATEMLLDPRFIEAMATRLFNETPGGVGVPRSESDMSQSAQAEAVSGADAPDAAAQAAPPPVAPSQGDADSSMIREIARQMVAQVPLGLASLAETDPELHRTLAGALAPAADPRSAQQADGAMPAYYFLSESAPVPDVANLADLVRQLQTMPGEMSDLPMAFEKLAGGAVLDRSALQQSAQSQQAPRGMPGAPGPEPSDGARPVMPASAQTPAQDLEIHRVRQDFPALHQNVHGKPLIWLDNAATTQKPQSVIDAVSGFYERDNSNVHRGSHALAARATDAYEGAREKVQRFVGAGSAAEIVFVRGTTEGINLVAQSYGRTFLRAGDEILLTTLEHHSNIVPWQMLAQETGAVLRVVPVSDEGEILLDQYGSLLGPSTRLVAMSHASNAIGTVLPVKEMIEMAHRYQARVLVDGAQAVAHLPVDVQALDCDFYVFSGHKLFAPTGIGAVYGKKHLLDAMPPWQGGGSMMRKVTFEETTYQDSPGKFEAGTPNIGGATGLGVAVDYLSRIGLETIANYEQALGKYASARLSEVPGLRQVGTATHKIGVFSFLLKDIPAEEVGRLLDLEGFAVRAGHHCAQPTMDRFGVAGTVRASLALYNTFEEIDALAAALRTIQENGQ